MRHRLPIVVAGTLLLLAGCGSQPAPVAEQARPPTADERYDEFHDVAKPHLQSFMAKHNPIAARMHATNWELGAAGLIPR